eukprot:gene42961-53510_t
MPDGAIGEEWLPCNVRLPGELAVGDAAADAPLIEDDVGRAAPQIDQGAADAAGPEPTPPPQPAHQDNYWAQCMLQQLGGDG